MAFVYSHSAAVGLTGIGEQSGMETAASRLRREVLLPLRSGSLLLDKTYNTHAVTLFSIPLQLFASNTMTKPIISFLISFC